LFFLFLYVITILGDNMNNKKAFTLVELIAVIVIMGVILTIAVPNSLTMVNRNKKVTVINDAKNFISLVKYKMDSDKDVVKPDDGEAIVVTLDYLNTPDIVESPYNNNYSKTLSFVVVTADTREIVTDYYINQYTYYVHLVACNDETCESITDINNRYGTVLASLENLSGANRLDYIYQGDSVQARILVEETYANYLPDDYEVIRVYQ